MNKIENFNLSAWSPFMCTKFKKKKPNLQCEHSIRSFIHGDEEDALKFRRSTTYNFDHDYKPFTKLV